MGSSITFTQRSTVFYLHTSSQRLAGVYMKKPRLRSHLVISCRVEGHTSLSLMPLLSHYSDCLGGVWGKDMTIT